MASYRKKHVRTKIGRIKPKKTIFKILWFWLTVLLLLAILVVAYFVIFYSGFQLKNIVIVGNDKVRSQDLQDLVSSGSVTGLINFWDIKITSKSIFLINVDKINKDILYKFPTIEKVKINKKWPQTLTVGIEERKPLGVFCSSNSKCFLIDNNGIIFNPLETIPSNTTIVRQISENEQVFTGEEVIAQNIINSIYNIQKSLKDNFQIDLSEALITSPIRLNVTTNKNWKIYFDLGPEADINSQLVKLNLLLSGGITANQMNNLRYINLIPKDKAEICDNSTCGK